MISAIILTKNEAENIERCLKSIKFCDELVIIDDNSTDITVDTARKYHVKIYKNALTDFSSQRNFGLSKVKNEWVLFIDADEEISKELQEEMLEAVKSNNYDGYKIPRHDFLWNKKLKHGDVKNVSVLRLGKKSKGKWKGDVHEVWDVEGKIGNLQHPIYHYPHDSISKFLSEINFYSTLRAEELKTQKKSVNFHEIVFFPIGKFFNLFILKLGFLDGIAGIVHALLMSFYSFLVRGKLYLLKNA